MRPFTYNKQGLNEDNIPFYTRIGLLSVRFSEIESLINHINEKLINPDEEMIGFLLMERNSLDKNLEILAQLVNQRAYEQDKIMHIISEIKHLKNTRNSFIHGVWSDVEINKSESFIYCANHKWIRKKVPNGTQSTRYKSEKYSLKDLDSTIKKAEEISFELKKIWEVLSDLTYFE